MLELAERLKADAPKIAAAMLRGVERRPIHPPRESVEEAVERLRGALEGRVALAFLHGGRARGYALRGDYDVAVLMEQGCDLCARTHTNFFVCERYIAAADARP